MAGRDFIRDELGRFARTAGKRAAKKIKKTVEQKAAELAADELARLKAAAAETKIAKAIEEAQQAVKDAAKKARQLEKAGSDSDVEEADRIKIKAHAQLVKALRRRAQSAAQ